jgi:hypothetical protein
MLMIAYITLTNVKGVLMKKFILSVAIAAALYTNVAVASDDDYRGGTTSTVSTNNQNTNTNRNNNRNSNTNTQRQQQVARGGSARSTAQGGNATGGNASANGNGSGNVTNISDNYQEARNVASAATPFLVTSGEDTCLGSVGGGVQTQILGLSGSKTVVDENCVLIKNTKLLIAMGYDSAACYYVRQNPKINEAMTAAGNECSKTPPVVTEDVPIPSDPENKSAAIIRNQYK